jgi:hypothetical protein
MTTPSRKSEIRRTRARKQKIVLLRKRYAKASSEAERSRILDKLRRASPTFPVEEFVKTVPKSSG